MSLGNSNNKGYKSTISRFQEVRVNPTSIEGALQGISVPLTSQGGQRTENRS